MEDFSPGHSTTPDLYLTGLDLRSDGRAVWTFKNGFSRPLPWTTGRAATSDGWTARYFLRHVPSGPATATEDSALPAAEPRTQPNIRRQTAGQNAPYLFIEWISGDVTLRGQTPSYYVLRRESPLDGQ